MTLLNVQVETAPTYVPAEDGMEYDPTTMQFGRALRRSGDHLYHFGSRRDGGISPAGTINSGYALVPEKHRL